MSPKKQASAKLPAPSQLKIQRKLSPNKKVPILNRSPVNKRTSPSSSSCSVTTNNVPPNSPALLTAKKLKRFIDSSDTFLFEDDAVGNDSGQRRAINRMRRMSKPYRQKDKQTVSGDESNAPISDDMLDGAHEEDKPAVSEPEIHPIETVETQLPIVWTRDEDRLLLEEIKSHINSNTDIVERISHRFPERSVEDVEGRIEFLVDFLNQLQNKKIPE